MRLTFVQQPKQSQHKVERHTEVILLMAFALVLTGTTGCNGLPSSTPAPAAGPQTYMSPIIAGNAPGGTTLVGSTRVNTGASYYLSTYTVDDTVDTFSQTTTSFIGAQQGTAVNDAGSFTMLQRGLLNLTTTYTFPYFGSTTGAQTYAGSYAVELASQAGGLVQFLGQPATPLVATPVCPSIAVAETFQFITLPEASFISANQTAFGSVSITANGTTVNFSNIQQFTLPSVNGGAPGTPASVYASTATGACSLSPYGNTISIPANVVTDPNGGAPQTPPVILGIGPSGLLVESLAASNSSPNNVLGAGTGAIGVPQPSSPLGATPVAGTSQPQYLGFIYSSGGVVSGSPTIWTSTVASFGFPTVPSGCSTVTPQTGTLIYGGDFPVNTATGLPDPTPANAQNPNYPYGNCDFAIDLGTESATNNGLYPAAKVWISSQFAANTTSPKKTYSFPAVAIASQLQGKFVILLIGEDTTSNPHQAWSIYLMQSN